ncbi:hypothetical protein ABK040_009098 [Willaertia magna]
MQKPPNQTVTSLRIYIPVPSSCMKPLSNNNNESNNNNNEIDESFDTIFINYKKLMKEAKSSIEKHRKPSANSRKTIDDNEGEEKTINNNLANEAIQAIDENVPMTSSSSEIPVNQNTTAPKLAEGEEELTDSETENEYPNINKARRNNNNSTKEDDEDTEGEITFDEDGGILLENEEEEEDENLENNQQQETRKRLKRNTVLTKEKLSQPNLDPDEFDWELLSESNSHISRLSSVIHNITNRERMLKNQLLQQPVKLTNNNNTANSNSGNRRGRKKNIENEMIDYENDQLLQPTNKKKGDFYEYESDDSFIDDTEYDGYLNMIDEENFQFSPQAALGGFDSRLDPYQVNGQQQGLNGYGHHHGGSGGSSLKKKSKFFPGGDVVSASSSEESDDEGAGGGNGSDSNSESLSDNDNTTTSRKKAVFPKELEDAINEAKLKADELGYTKDQTYKTIPTDMFESLKKIAIIRTKYFKKGVPNVLLKKLRQIPPFDFGPKTIKDRMKALLYENDSQKFPQEMDELKKKLKEMICNDMKANLKKRKEKNKEEFNQNYDDMSHEELCEIFKNTEGIRLHLSKETNDMITAMVRKVLKNVETTNANKKKGDTELDKNKEISNFANEVKKLWPAKFDIKKKLKSLCPELKDIPSSSSSGSGATTASTSTSTKDSKDKETTTNKEVSTTSEVKEEKKKKKKKEIKEEAESGEKKRKRKITREASSATTTTSGTATNDKGEKESEKTEQQEKEPRVSKKKKKVTTTEEKK